MTSSQLHPVLGEVILSQTRRARRISISVRASGVVRLSFPPGASQRRAWDFLESKVVWITRAQERLAQKRAALPPQLTPAEASARTEELRRAAKADLPGRIDAISRQVGLKYARLTIRASRTKWGSCTGQNHISLSLFLMTLPEHLRDYVIIHELCHTIHHDHSPRFHALVDKLTSGREKALRAELRAFSIQ